MSASARFTRAGMLEALSRASRANGSDPLTIARYRALRKDGPSPELIRTNFGSWSAACEAAGVVCGPSPARPVTRIPDAVLAASLVDYVRECIATDVKPGYAGFERHCRTHCSHSAVLVRARLREQATSFTRAVALITENLNPQEQTS